MHGDESDERVRDARHSSILKEVEVWVKSIFISNCATKPLLRCIVELLTTIGS